MVRPTLRFVLWFPYSRTAIRYALPWPTTLATDRITETQLSQQSFTNGTGSHPHWLSPSAPAGWSRLTVFEAGLYQMDFGGRSNSEMPESVSSGFSRHPNSSFSPHQDCGNRRRIVSHPLPGMAGKVGRCSGNVADRPRNAQPSTHFRNPGCDRLTISHVPIRPPAPAHRLFPFGWRL